MELKSDSVIGSNLKGVYCGIIIEGWNTGVRRNDTTQK